ncbi:hypothetical protein EDB87DRAFT_1574732 [Lactarius vividus]|nr:hypothetical protein EDB87DRAFT_1574732 [Lactarius vividus]
MTFYPKPTHRQVETIYTDYVPQDQEVIRVSTKSASDDKWWLFRWYHSVEQYSILSQNVIRDTLEGHEYPHAFQVSLEEKEVIECTKSSFVLGRSGAGKTTVIVFKIFGIERAWQNRGSIGQRPRQLFIAKSQLLANKVEKDYVNPLFSLHADPDAPQYICERIKHWNSRRGNNVLDQDCAEGMRDDLSERFSKLQDGHFPLFITVDTLWSLLEADMRPSPTESRHSRSQQRDNKWLGRTDLVTFDVFKKMLYWRHLPQTLTKGIVPSVAFGDIIATVFCGLWYLSLNFWSSRDYQGLKRKWRERDSADRTHDLLDGIKDNGFKGELVDFVDSFVAGSYVDEVQDLLIDARHGFLWAGDTAQTKSIGSTFSFKQLGAFIFRYQVRDFETLRERLTVSSEINSISIVECSNAIINLLQRFPGAIDVLQPEAGIAGKAMPVFFHSDCLPSQERDFFLLSNGRPCMVGSKQLGVSVLSCLEYDDVILYNFFGESADANLWQHLTNAHFRRLENLKYAALIHEVRALHKTPQLAGHKYEIQRHLLNLGLVVHPTTSRNPLENFTDRSTTPEEWSEAGKQLLHPEEFEEAAMAFLNAGDDCMHSVAMACHLQEVARDTPESALKRRKEAFASAASAFERCAGMTENEEVGRSRYVAAARCSAEIGRHTEVDRPGDDKPYQAGCTTILFGGQNLDEAAKLFDNEGELMEFVVQHELWVARAAILWKQKNYRKAIRQYLDEGEELDALEITAEYIDEGLRSREQQMLSLFKLIFLGKTSTTSQKTLADHILRCDRLDKALKLLALDLYFDDMCSALDVSSQSGFLSSLQLFYEYSLLMRDAAFDKAPWNSPWLCMLFQIERHGEKVRIKQGTLLYEHCTHGGSSRPKEQIKLSRQMFSKSLNRLLWERLDSRISEKDRVSSSLSLFDLCVSQRRLLGALESALNPLYHLSGSLASLNKDLIPEAANAFVTVQRWALDVLSNLDPSQDDHQGAFLTDLCKTLRDFLAFLDGSGSLKQGVEFSENRRYLVQERLPVDLAVLCTIVERLFGLAIMIARHNDLGSLHGVLLPRTWILALWGDFLRFKKRSLAPLEHLVSAAGKLLVDIYTGEYQRHAIMDPDPQKRTPADLKNKAPNVTEDIPPKYIQDLVAYADVHGNQKMQVSVPPALRDDVHAALSLRKIPSPESVAFHERYINARKWEDLADALYQLTTSPFDRLVRLRLESSSISGPQIPEVDLITFKDINSIIPNVLHSRPGGQSITTIGLRENTEGSDAAITGQITATDRVDGMGDLTGYQHCEKAAEYSEGDAFDIGDGEGPDRSRETLIIQKAVHRYLLKHCSSDKLKTKRDRHFEACKASVGADARYRKIYLGPVPHLLLCLEWIISSARASKNTTKARRRDATLQAVWDLTSQQTQMKTRKYFI